jgi:hypothetical protein
MTLPPGRQLPLPGAARSAASRSDAIDSLPRACSQIHNATVQQTSSLEFICDFLVT